MSLFSRKINFVLPLIHVMLGVIKPHTHLYGVTFAYPVENILHFDKNLAWPSNYPKHSLLSTLQVWHFGSDLMIFDGLFGKILEFSHSLCVKLLILSVWPSLKASKGLKISKVFGFLPHFLRKSAYFSRQANCGPARLFFKLTGLPSAGWNGGRIRIHH